jgi:hypothetical protein
MQLQVSLQDIEYKSGIRLQLPCSSSINASAPGASPLTSQKLLLEEALHDCNMTSQLSYSSN